MILIFPTLEFYCSYTFQWYFVKSLPQACSQGLLCFQDGGWARRSPPSDHLESRIDPGNEVDFTNEQIEFTVTSKLVAMAMTKLIKDTLFLTI